MIRIDKHIEVLLLDNDCVIIPDFGGFVAHHREAQYDAEENTFLPPFRTVGFNPQLKINDSLLVTSYIETYDISYPEALKRIENEVSELQEIIKHDGSYVFNGLGTLFNGSNNSYRFEPNPAGILTPDFYALSSTDIEPLSKMPLLRINSKGKGKNVKKGSQAEVKMIQLRKSIASNIAVAAIVAICFMVFPRQAGNSLFDRYQQQARPITAENVLPSPKTTAPSNASTKTLSTANTSNANKSVNNTIVGSNRNDSQNNDKPASSAQETAAPKSYFSVVLASKVSKTNAQDFVNRLNKRGLTEAAVLEQSSGSRVVYGKYKSEAEAYAALSSLRKEKDLKDAWVMLVK